MVQINWVDNAKIDLKEIYEYIGLDSKRYARLQVSRIKRAVDKLKKYPCLGKIVDEIQEVSIREVVEGNYRIIYRIVSENQIDILMVHHGARDLIRRIKE